MVASSRSVGSECSREWSGAMAEGALTVVDVKRTAVREHKLNEKVDGEDSHTGCRVRVRVRARAENKVGMLV